ncbi:ISAs1 family transposase [Candidatus Neptunichlamydia sp. REUL1]|uniref:ISAs1 family transposase n=1 Tax=Candidatus Neptunichlamydia sp. REUL1 TaxID=3064277 RepID=UPI00292F3324|nr:ISAs1 family transposase [Candidatus Neptunochlamydia sp. REUL1]
MSKKQVAKFYSEVDQPLDQQAFIESIEIEFKDIQDPRAKDNLSYPLVALLVIILAAVIAGANAIIHIHEYACTKISLFQRLLGIKKPPSYTVFWWLLVMLNPQKLQETFIRWMKALPVEVKKQIIAIDGKRLNGASKQTVHLVSAWETGRSLLLGQVKTEEKSNEITAIPELIKAIDIKGSIITIDAAGCQKKIVEDIRRAGGDYVIALKGNQGTLHDEAQNFFDQAREVEYEGAECARAKKIEKAHGRIEEREVAVASNLEWLDCREEWQDLKTLIEVTSRREVRGKVSVEKRHYISSLSLIPQEAIKLVRGHWGIENHLHWMMDVVFKEDACCISTGNAPENFAVFRRMAQSILQVDAKGTKGIAKRRRLAGWNDSYLIKLLGILINDTSVKSFL